MYLRDYEYIVELSKTGSILKAAEALNLSGSALSKYVRGVEEKLGVQLFDRTFKTFRLTYAGERYVENARRLIAQNAQLEKQMQDIKNMDDGRLRLGFPRLRSNFVIREILPHVRRKYPHVKLILRENSTRMIEKMLLNGELDMILVQSDMENPELEYIPLSTEEQVLAVPRESPLVAKAIRRDGFTYPWIDLSLCAGEEFIVCYPDQAARQITDTWFKTFNISPPIAFQARGLESCLLAVSENLGLSIIPADQPIYGFSFANRIALLSFGDKPERKDLVLAYRKDTYLTNIEQDMIELFCQAAERCHHTPKSRTTLK